MAQVAVAVSHGDGTAAVAGGGVGLEAGELLAAGLGAVVGDRGGVGGEERELVGFARTDRRLAVSDRDTRDRVAVAV